MVNYSKDLHMKINLLLFLMLLISRETFAQNWSLFPINQNSFYLDNPYSNYKSVDSYVMDSIKVNGQDSILYFRRNLNLQGAGTCYIDTLQNYPWAQNNMYFIDSLVQRNDSLFFFSPYSQTPFYFLPNAIAGQSWTVTSTYGENDYNQITITCQSIQPQTFFGITDSVKTFTMTAIGKSENQDPLDSLVMRLSKSHGLIEFVPFILFLYHPGYIEFTTLEMIGCDSAGTLYGYQQPKFSGYFHLSVGDILLWEHHYDPDNITELEWTEYFRDSITQVAITPDSVIYTYDQARQDTNNVITYQFGLTDKYFRSEFQNIVETPTNWIGFGNIDHIGWYFPAENNVLTWKSNTLSLTVDSLSGDTITAYSFINDATSVDTTSCQTFQVFDIIVDFTVDTRAGITQHCFWNFGYDCYTLTGSLISGQQNGNILLSSDEINPPNSLAISIYPNPASDKIFIRNVPQSNRITYTIFNNLGIKAGGGKLTGNSVSTSELQPGLYILTIETDKRIGREKFIKY
jgi:hypothetical protein